MTIFDFAFQQCQQQCMMFCTKTDGTDDKSKRSTSRRNKSNRRNKTPWDTKRTETSKNISRFSTERLRTPNNQRRQQSRSNTTQHRSLTPSLPPSLPVGSPGQHFNLYSPNRSQSSDFDRHHFGLIPRDKQPWVWYGQTVLNVPDGKVPAVDDDCAKKRFRPG